MYSLYTGFAHLASGLCCGLSIMAAGMAIVSDVGVRAVGQQEKVRVESGEWREGRREGRSERRGVGSNTPATRARFTRR